MFGDSTARSIAAEEREARRPGKEGRPMQTDIEGKEVWLSENTCEDKGGEIK